MALNKDATLIAKSSTHYFGIVDTTRNIYLWCFSAEEVLNWAEYSGTKDLHAAAEQLALAHPVTDIGAMEWIAQEPMPKSEILEIIRYINSQLSNESELIVCGSID